jgi:acetyl-CoA carboxylase carboxyltransferase component
LYGAGRIFLYNWLMRRNRRIPQTAAVMGHCIAGGAHLPALSDCIIMSFMGLGGPGGGALCSRDGEVAARGHCDAVIDPLDTRGVLSLALEACMQHAVSAPAWERT